jgi:hypothetical protein
VASHRAHQATVIFSEKILQANEALLRACVPGAQGQCGCTSSSPSFFAEWDDMMEAIPQNECLTHTFTRSPWS